MTISARLTATDYANLKTAYVELLTGQAVVRVTLNGKSTEFAQRDVKAIRAALTEYELSQQTSKSFFNKVRFGRPV